MSSWLDVRNDIITYTVNQWSTFTVASPVGATAITPPIEYPNRKFDQPNNLMWGRLTIIGASPGLGSIGPMGWDQERGIIDFALFDNKGNGELPILTATEYAMNMYNRVRFSPNLFAAPTVNFLSDTQFRQTYMKGPRYEDNWIVVNVTAPFIFYRQSIV